MFLKTTATLLLLSVAFTVSTKTTYDYYKIYDIEANDELQKNFLLSLSANNDYEFFILPKSLKEPARVLVKPDDQFDFENLLTQSGLTFTVINSDVARSVVEQHQQNELASSLPENSPVSFNRYLRHEEINAYLEQLARNYPTRVIVKTVGKSYEDRDIKAIRITNGDARENKKVILVDAGIDAREWIAPATALYVIKQLVENFSQNAHLLKDYDWVVLPVVNPDGYEYSHTTSRLWRKTRKPVTSLCAGADINRNFGFHWGEIGVSTDACSNNFMGQAAFSEVETRVLRDLMLSFNGRATMYLTLHAFGNYLLYPWSFKNEKPSNWMDLDEVAQAGAAAIYRATGKNYTVGSVPEVLYPVAGGSDDYAIGKANIPIAVTMKLPAGRSGFDPIPPKLSPLVQESWIGIQAMAERVIAKY